MTTTAQKAIYTIRRALTTMLESIDVIDKNLAYMEEKPKIQAPLRKSILLTGNCKVGKTSFINKLIKSSSLEDIDIPNNKYVPTDCITSYDVVDEKRHIVYKIYDLSGDNKEDPRDMLQWFGDVEHIIIMCSMDDYHSIKSVKYWVREYNYFNRPFSLMINKVDILESINDRKRAKYDKKIEYIASKHDLNTRYVSVQDDKREELLLDLHKLVSKQCDAFIERWISSK